MKICEMCGGTTEGAGGAIVCRKCAPELVKLLDEAQTDGRIINPVHIARKAFRTGSNYFGRFLLRDIPLGLWKAVKHLAIDEGCSIREIILLALWEYVRARERRGYDAM